MAAPKIPPITPQRWLVNLLDVGGDIADKNKQEERWLAPDAKAWEHPEELINIVEDCVLYGFIEAFESTFSSTQKSAIIQFRDELNSVCAATPQCLKPEKVLVDPRWDGASQRR